MTSAPASRWMQDDAVQACINCNTAFTLFLRRHHCRRCGGIFCATCSAQRVPLPSLGFAKEVRVCDVCFDVVIIASEASRLLRLEGQPASIQLAVDSIQFNGGQEVSLENIASRLLHVAKSRLHHLRLLEDGGVNLLYALGACKNAEVQRIVALIFELLLNFASNRKILNKTNVLLVIRRDLMQLHEDGPLNDFNSSRSGGSAGVSPASSTSSVRRSVTHKKFSPVRMRIFENCCKCLSCYVPPAHVTQGSSTATILKLSEDLRMLNEQLPEVLPCIIELACGTFGLDANARVAAADFLIRLAALPDTLMVALEHNALKPFILFSLDESDRWQMFAATAFDHFSKGRMESSAHPLSPLIEQGMLLPLMELCAHSNADVRVHACNALYNLCSATVENRRKVCEFGGLGALMSLAEEDAIRSVALNTLVLLVTEVEQLAKYFWPVLPQLFKVLCKILLASHSQAGYAGVKDPSKKYTNAEAVVQAKREARRTLNIQNNIRPTLSLLVALLSSDFSTVDGGNSDWLSACTKAVERLTVALPTMLSGIGAESAHLGAMLEKLRKLLPQKNK